MSYYRDPDDLPGGIADGMDQPAPAAPAAPSDMPTFTQPAPPPAAPSPAGAPAAPPQPSMAGFTSHVAAEDAKRKRMKTIILACVAVDLVILLVVGLIFVL